MIWFCVVAPSLINIFSSNPRIPFSDDLIFLREGIICGLLVLTVSGLSDFLYFGFWTFPPYQWLTFNITLDLAVFYGRNDWHYYFSQGLPLLTTTYLPFTLIGLWRATSGIQMILAIIIFQMIGTLSLIAHKEVRFIYPLLPLLHILTGPAIASYFTTSPQPPSTKIKPPPPTSLPRTTIRRKPLLIALLIVNAAIAYYTSRRHQSGVLSVQTFLRHEYESLYLTPSLKSTTTTTPEPTNANPPPLFAAYLLPCHSTPWRSSLVHPGLQAWALTCEPPITVAPSERSAYQSEADHFYADPSRFLRESVGRAGRAWPPRYIVGFEGLGAILDGLEDDVRLRVKERWRAFNSDWIDDEQRWGDVVVWEVLEG